MRREGTEKEGCSILPICISYISTAGIKQHDQLVEESIYFGFWFQKVAGVATGGGS